jgi:glycosyltransferase involved in cell wall biosynthesis
MKVIFITREGEKLPGARIRCYNFARELAKYGINTEVLSYSATLGAKDGEQESQMGVIDKIKFNYSAFKKISNEKKAILFIQRFNYHSFAPYLAGLFNKNRIVLDLDDWEMRDDPKYYFGLYPSSKAHYFTRQIARKSIFCIAASRFLEGFLRQFNKKVYFIPSGVDTGKFKPALNNSDGKEIIFSWIGTFHRKEYIENINFAINCFTRLRNNYPHIYFDIVGDGIYRKAITEAVNTANDPHIRLIGWIEPDKIPEYLRHIDIGLLPVAGDNKFNRAKSPTKLFEYMAMAKPTVSSIIGEAENIIQNGENGLLARTKEEFVGQMQRLAENPQMRRTMGEKASQAVEDSYSLKVLGKQLAQILEING